MAEEHGKLEQSKREKPVSFITTVIIIGFIGGVFWSALSYLAYWLNFTEIRPNVIIEPWTIGDWKENWLGTVISITLIGVISIAVAILYYVALRKFGSMLIGIGYGVVLFLLVFFVLNPIFPSIRPIAELKWLTIITSICFYILYGVFIGYSISYEENEIRNREKSENNDREVTS